MSYKLKKLVNERRLLWLINDCVVASVGSPTAEGYEGDPMWLEYNTNVRCDEINRRLMSLGFRPIRSCYGVKVKDKESDSFHFELKDAVQWYSFDGVSTGETESEFDFLSIVVNYDKEKQLYTVYNHDIKNEDYRKIGVFEGVYGVFNLVKNYIPIVYKGMSDRYWELDWGILYNENIGVGNLFPDISLYIRDAMDVSCGYRRLVGKMINSISRKMPDGGLDEAKSELYKAGDDSHYKFEARDSEGQYRFMADFIFNEDGSVTVNSSTDKDTHDKIEVTKCKYEDREEEIRKVLLPNMGVYFASKH